MQTYFILLNYSIVIQIYDNYYLSLAGHANLTSTTANEAEETLRKTIRGLFHKVNYMLSETQSFSNVIFTNLIEICRFVEIWMDYHIFTSLPNLL